MKFTKEDMIRAHGFSVNHKAQLEKDKVCGCFYCGTIFSPKQLTEDDWMINPADHLGTAVCPYCMVDSVIGESSGYPITKEFLAAMKEYWF